jgi:single-strand DNA-binding protein
MYQNRI